MEILENLRFNLDGKAYNLVYQTSSDTGLTVVGMIPTSFLQKTARELEKNYCAVNRNQHSTVCFFLQTLWRVEITGPIEQTSNAMEKICQRRFLSASSGRAN